MFLYIYFKYIFSYVISYVSISVFYYIYLYIYIFIVLYVYKKSVKNYYICIYIREFEKFRTSFSILRYKIVNSNKMFKNFDIVINRI